MRFKPDSNFTFASRRWWCQSKLDSRKFLISPQADVQMKEKARACDFF